jgi:hypothetical protein
MSAMLLLALAVAPVAPAPPPPMVVTTPSLSSESPRVIVLPAPSFSGPRTTDTINVQLRVDDRLLWSGDLTRASDGTASFSQQMRESRACPDASSGSRGTTAMQNSSLSVMLAPSYPIDGGTLRVSIERTRPYGAAAAHCDGEEGSSTLRFESRAQLAPGKPVTLKGEGGLSATLTRR